MYLMEKVIMVQVQEWTRPSVSKAFSLLAVRQLVNGNL